MRETVYSAMFSSRTALVGFCHAALFAADQQDTEEQSEARAGSHLIACASELAEEQ